MGILGRQTVLAKCPSCQATTKVNAHPDKPSIRCPRCKATIPLTFARKYNPSKTDADPEHVPENTKVQQSLSSYDYGSENLKSADQHESATSSKKRQRRYSSNAGNVVSYPDHAVGFIRYSYLIAAVLIVSGIVGVAYLIWSDASRSKYQEYVDNIRDSVEQHRSAITQLRKANDPLEAAEAQKNFRDAKAKIAYLAVHRKRMKAPAPAGDESLSTLLNEHEKSEKELVQAEDEFKRLSTKIQIKPESDDPVVVSPNLGFSVTSGPPAASPSKAGSEPPKAIDRNSVVISIPGLTKEQWSEEFTRRFALLADDGKGQVTVKWSGDLLTLEVRPVVDHARYATKINFGRLLYYSRNDRTLTIEFKPERVNNYSAQGDLITPVLIDLKQREKLPKLHAALTQLGNYKVDPARQAEVATVLETIVLDLNLDSSIRILAIKLMPLWSGKESAELLIRLLDDKSPPVRLTAIDALVETHSPLAAAALVKKWDKLDPERISQGLIALGSEAEPVVLPFLNNTSNLTLRTQACRVLQHIGTTESLKPLLDLMNVKDQNPTIVNAAKEAMKQILDRKSK